MISKRTRLVVVLFLVLAQASLAALGNAEITYSINGEGYLMRNGALVDDVRGKPGVFAVSTDRPRWAAGGSGAARVFFRVAEYLDQAQDHPTTDYLFEPMGSSLAAKAVLNGQLDWAGIGRSLLLAEKAAGLVETTIAWDSLYILVPEAMPVESLGLAQIAGIYTGEIRNWKEVGGPDLAISPFAYSERSGLAGAFRDLVLEPTYGDDGRLAPSVRLLDYDSDVFDKVGSTPGAIGFSLQSIDPVAARGPLRTLAINHIDHRPEEVASGRYPLARPLNFITRGEPGGKAAEFLDLLLSERLQETLPRIRLVPAAEAP